MTHPSPPAHAFGHEIPFVHHLGFEMVAMGGGASHLAFSPRPEHLNHLGVVHGGAIMTLLDVTLATASRSLGPDLAVITIELKTTFMQPCQGRLEGRGRLMHRTGGMAFAEGSIHDESGRVCAHATGTFKYVKRPATGQADATPPTDH